MMQITNQKVWNSGDHDAKWFLDIYRMGNDGNLHVMPIQEIEIGKPVILQLTDGQFIRTSSVQRWTILGGMRIYTKNRTYYAVTDDNVRQPIYAQA